MSRIVGDVGQRKREDELLSMSGSNANRFTGWVIFKPRDSTYGYGAVLIPAIQKESELIASEPGISSLVRSKFNPKDEIKNNRKCFPFIR